MVRKERENAVFLRVHTRDSSMRNSGALDPWLYRNTVFFGRIHGEIGILPDHDRAVMRSSLLVRKITVKAPKIKIKNFYSGDLFFDQRTILS